MWGDLQANPQNFDCKTEDVTKSEGLLPAFCLSCFTSLKFTIPFWEILSENQVRKKKNMFMMFSIRQVWTCALFIHRIRGFQKCCHDTSANPNTPQHFFSFPKLLLLFGHVFYRRTPAGVGAVLQLLSGCQRLRWPPLDSTWRKTSCSPFLLTSSSLRLTRLAMAAGNTARSLSGTLSRLSNWQLNSCWWKRKQQAAHFSEAVITYKEFKRHLLDPLERLNHFKSFCLWRLKLKGVLWWRGSF